MASESENKKRPRATNFTPLETRLLAEEVLKNVHVIENKETDAVTWKIKNAAWDQLCESFNAKSSAANRTASQLRTKYEGIKRALKQKLSRNKMQLYKTGGGAAEITPLTDYEASLVQVLTLSVEGLPSSNDSDGVCNTMTIEIPQVGPLDGIKTSPKDDGVDVEDELMARDQPSIANQAAADATVETQPSTSGAEASAPVVDGSVAGPATEPWGTWNPQKMRNPGNKKLRKSKANLSEVKEKYHTLADKRNELLELQLLAARSDIECKNKLSRNLDAQNQRAIDRDLFEKKLMLESHKKKMEILELEKQNLLKNVNK